MSTTTLAMFDWRTPQALREYEQCLYQHPRRDDTQAIVNGFNTFPMVNNGYLLHSTITGEERWFAAQDYLWVASENNAQWDQQLLFTADPQSNPRLSGAAAAVHYAPEQWRHTFTGYQQQRALEQQQYWQYKVLQQAWQQLSMALWCQWVQVDAPADLTPEHYQQLYAAFDAVGQHQLQQRTQQEPQAYAITIEQLYSPEQLAWHQQQHRQAHHAMLSTLISRIAWHNAAVFWFTRQTTGAPPAQALDAITGQVAMPPTSSPTPDMVRHRGALYQQFNHNALLVLQHAQYTDIVRAHHLQPTDLEDVRQQWWRAQQQVAAQPFWSRWRQKSSSLPTTPATETTDTDYAYVAQGLHYLQR